MNTRPPAAWSTGSGAPAIPVAARAGSVVSLPTRRQEGEDIA